MWIIMEHCLVHISTCKSNAFTLKLSAAEECSFSLFIYLYVFLWSKKSTILEFSVIAYADLKPNIWMRHIVNSKQSRNTNGEKCEAVMQWLVFTLHWGRYHREPSSQLITLKSHIYLRNWNIQSSGLVGLVAKSSVYKTMQFWKLLSLHLRFWVSFNLLSSKVLKSSDFPKTWLPPSPSILLMDGNKIKMQIWK